jgi:protein-tyrosine phosphatase
MCANLYTVAYDGPGRVSIMAKPHGGDSLAGEMTALREAGVDVLVSALTPDEVEEAGLAQEAHYAALAGLRFVSVPVEDMSVPGHEDVLPALKLLARELGEGRHLVAHCWAGIGRSSLLAASLMVLNGMVPDEAWRRISEARGCTVPETTAQRDWIFQLSWPRARA